jgi:hypothetical protein
MKACRPRVVPIRLSAAEVEQMLAIVAAVEAAGRDPFASYDVPLFAFCIHKLHELGDSDASLSDEVTKTARKCGRALGLSVKTISDFLERDGG